MECVKASQCSRRMTHMAMPVVTTATIMSFGYVCVLKCYRAREEEMDKGGNDEEKKEAVVCA